MSEAKSDENTQNKESETAQGELEKQKKMVMLFNVASVTGGLVN